MTLVVIGPVTHDFVVIGGEESHKVGGATYFQSFVFEEFHNDYVAIVNCSDDKLIEEFPSRDKVKVIRKDDTHFFINNYPEEILPCEIDGFVLNPLNRFDFPAETVEYLKSFGVPIFLSLQGFLRVPDVQVNDNYTIKLSDFDELASILSGVDVIFLDESEKNIIGTGYDVDEMVITNGSHGSRIVSDSEIRIDAVPCVNLVDTTGCGDTYMAAYISQKLLLKSPETAGNFASMIASEKIENFGPYNFNK